MRGYLYLIKKEFVLMLKNKSFYLWVVILPLITLLVFQKMGSGGEKPSIFVKDTVKTPITKEFKERLERDYRILKSFKKGIPVVEIKRGLNKNGKLKIEITIPEDYREGKEAFLKISVFKALAEVFAKHKLGIKRVKEFVKLKVKREKLVEIPWGIKHSLPAIILMFILFNTLTKGTEKFYHLKESGLIERLLTSPSHINGVLSFFLLYEIVLTTISITLVFVAGILFFKFSISIKTGVILYGIFLLFALFTSSLSILMFSLFKKREASIGAGVLIANMLCALGGLWWPLEIVPHFFKKLGLILPTGLTMNTIDTLLYYNLPFSSIILQLILLTGYSLFFFFVSSLIFKKRYNN